MRIIGTHHVGISTPDLDRLLEFYVDVLGLQPDGGFPDQNIAFVDAGTTLVELVGETAGNTDCRKSGTSWNGASPGWAMSGTSLSAGNTASASTGADSLSPS